MHCYFVLAGEADFPIIYHVERVRDGRSFATRTVQARQQGRPIFSTTLSFTRETSAGERTLEHAPSMPAVPFPHNEPLEVVAGGPFEVRRAGVVNSMIYYSSFSPFFLSTLKS